MTNEEPEWSRGLEAGLREGFGPRPDRDDSVLARIEKRGTPAPHVLLGDAPAGDTPVLKPAGGDVVGRYQLHGEIARGGVGIVLKGRDIDLGREVAMKVIRPEYADQPEILRRFIEEAQIGGQLQHPGIVPVYELGMRDDRRVFFTMKLIRGQTLAALLRDRTGEHGQWLRIFEQVCQTVAYAHARGVIHRDLKPSNVMVGAFGEVQVVDWGFAKVLAQGGVADEDASERQHSEVRTVRTGSSGSESQAGSVMGTPAYMPPEQALGFVERLDARSDVFALGAILCEILTGRPPYTRAGSEILVQAAQGDTSGALERLRACGAEAGLVDLCRRCLAAEPLARPADASELAKAVSGHLAAVEERARAAAVEAEKAKVRAAAERRARRLTVGLAASVLLAIGAAAAGLVVAGRMEKARAEQVAMEIQRAERLRGDKRWSEAAETAQRAAELAAGTDLSASAEELRAGIVAEAERLRRNEQLLSALEGIRTRRGEDRDLKEADAAYARAFATFGIQGEDVAAAVDRIRGTGIAADLAAYLDEWCWIRGIVDRPRDHLASIAAGADPDAWREGLRAAVAKGDRDALMALASKPSLEGSSPNLLALHLNAAKEYDTAVAVLRRAQRARPGDFWVNYDLGFGLTLLVPPRWSEAAGFFRVALSERPGSPEVLHQLGIALFKDGQLDEALAIFLDAASGDLHAYDHVIETAESKGELGALVETWRADAERGDWIAHYRLGRALETRAEWASALAAYGKALALAPSSFPRERIGTAHLYAGELELALPCFEEMLAVDPDSDEAWRGITDVHVLRGDLNEALAAIEEAIRLNPFDPFHYDRKGVILMWLDRRAESIKAAEAALRVRPDHGEARVHRAKLVQSLDERGRILEETLLLPERFAEGRFAMSIENTPDAATGGKKRRAVLGAHTPKANICNTLGGNHKWRGRWREAAEAYRRSLAYLPGFRIAQLNLGMTLRQLGDHAGAAEQLEAALAHPETADDPQVPYYLGFCLLGCGRIDDGTRRLREFGDHPFMQGAPAERRAQWERESAQAIALARDLPAILAGTRAWTSPREQLVAAWMCVEMGYAAAAARLFDAAFAAEPGLAAEATPWPTVWHYASCGALAAVVTGRGLASDGQDLPEEERRKWRTKALEWLRLDLETWRRSGDADGEARQLSEWMNNAIHALVRFPANLEELPKDEQAAWKAVWEEVESRRKELAPAR